MALYMLDTDICSYIMKRSSAAVLARLGRASGGEISMSSITHSELLFGVEVSPRQEKDREALNGFLRQLEVLAYGEEAGVHYAEIRRELKVTGAMIGANGLLIAAHARGSGLTLVTNNTREFGRVPGLRVENWAEPGR